MTTDGKSVLWTDADVHTPGQVPRKHIKIDPSRVPFEELQGLGTAEIRQLQKRIVAEARAASNGLEFRKSLMQWLIGRHPAKVRRKIMQYASKVYSEAGKPATPTQSYTNYTSDKRQMSLRKSEGEEVLTQEDIAKKLREDLKEIFLDRTKGVPVEDLVPLIKEHSQEEVSQALREMGGVSMSGDKVFLHEIKIHKSNYVLSKAPAKSGAGGEPAQGGTGGFVPVGEGQMAQQSAGKVGMGGPVGLAVGAKRVWHNRVLEKKPDGKWHVVGHIAGLEGEAIPSKRFKAGKEGIPLDIRSLTREQAEALIQAYESAKNSPRPRSPEKKSNSKSGNSTSGSTEN